MAVDRPSQSPAAGYARPDPSLTPGAVSGDPLSVICDSDYSREHRLAFGASAEHRRYRDIFRSYGIPAYASRYYELDHRVPLCLGGADVTANLWPQPIAEARAKDRLEREACRAVCHRTVPLATARGWFFGNWAAAYREVFGSSPYGLERIRTM